MIGTEERWMLCVVAETDRMVEAAMDELHDANEARWFVHRVMLSAMMEVPRAVSRRELDTALGRALRARTNPH